jgi:hypothetical protein
MPKVLVFSPQGEAVYMESVDARECIAHCGYDYAPPKQPAPGNLQLYRGFPYAMLDAGELGLIQFDENGDALVTAEQAEWLDDGVATGKLPAHDTKNTPVTHDMDDPPGPGLGEPSAGDPAEGAKVDGKPAKVKKPAPSGAEA